MKTMQQAVTWDPNFETAVLQFQERALAAQVKVASLHPIDKDLFVSQLREQMMSFYTDVQKGYEVLVTTVYDLNAAGVGLGGMAPTGKKSMKAVKHLFPSQEAIDQFSQEEFLDTWVADGTPLYQIFKLSTQAMATMYDAACYLLKENRDEEARTAFRLLLVLAPHMADFWIGYGVVLIRLGRYEEAIGGLEQAISLNPLSDEALLLLCRSLAELNRRSEAESRLTARIDEVAQRGERGRYDLLQAARNELAQFHK